ncbi:hypothetical protein EU528_00170 [Candidatus Thorarchaeota archaeon]|nr:MAG: hypothetical protein EU528_00170 [Candidatus Thorarchaeota archaeon]
MTAKKLPSLKTLEKACTSSNFQIGNQNVLLTSPSPEAAIASAIISHAISRTGALFHISFSQPVVPIETINALKEKFESSSIILVGIDALGKQRIKKGKGYPLFIGGTSELEQVNSLTLGTDSTVTAAGYVFAQSLIDLNDYNLQFAAAGALLNSGMNESQKGANKDIIDLAQNKGLIEERKGFKLFGVTMLPLDEALLYSTHPYLATISGDQKVCDAILNEAEIPIPKLRTPLGNLSTAEAQRLTSVLITRLDTTVFSRLMGPDNILTLERETSPIRIVSGIETMAKTAWAQNEPGALIGVLLGDRGRALRSLIDSQMEYHKAVIATVQRLESNLQGDSTTTTTTVKLTGCKSEILPEVGRIALESGIVDTIRPLALDNDEVFTIVWPSSELNYKMVHRDFLSTNTMIITSSPQSITITGNDEEKEFALQKIVQLNKGVGKK